MARRFALALCCLITGALFSTAAPARAATDIMILVDGSGSIDSDDWSLQRDGFVTALSDPANVPLDGSVAIGVVQWSSETKVEHPLTQIDDQADLDAVKAAIQNMPQMAMSTASGEGVFAGTAASVAGRRPGATPVHCMSTDGTTNEGRDLSEAVADAKAGGIQRFSVIGIEDYSGAEAQLRSHYGPHVFGGGAVTVGRNTAEFATLIGGSCFSPAVRLRALEVNQGVQDWENSVPTVSGRATVVRAFVEVPAGTPPTRVTGRLRGTRNGSELPGSPLAASNLGATILAREDITARRDELADSLNFVLPQDWVDGDVQLEFEAGGAPVDCKEPGSPGSAAADCLVAGDFARTNDLGITFWSIQLKGKGPHTGDLGEQIARARSALPISTLTTTMRGLSYPKSIPDLEDVNDDLHKIKQVERTSCGGNCVAGARDVYYGVLAGTGGGLANGIPGSTASGYTDDLNSRTSVGYARNRGPHEIAHTLGVHHAVDNSLGIHDRTFIWWGEGTKKGQCKEVASSDAPGHSPFVSTGAGKRPALGPEGDADTEVWGFDSRFAYGDVDDLGVIDPAKTWALMGYCDDGTGQMRWTSAFEWREALGGSPDSRSAGAAATRALADEPPVAPPDGHRGVLVSGEISSVSGAATIDPVLPLPYAGDAAPGSGPFTVRLEDAGGTTLATRRFTPQVRHGDNPGGEGEHDNETAAFAEVMSIPGDAVIAKVVVAHDATGDAGSAAGSGTAPPVTGLNADDTSIESAPVNLDWEGPAGTTYAVFFSRDDGASWSPVAFDVTDSGVALDPEGLGETTSGRIAVASSNGVNGTVADLGGITVANEAPTVEILSPAEDDVPPSGVQNVRFEAVAGDRDQEIAGDAVTWSSDRDGHLGTGLVLDRNATELTEGEHVITATVTDVHGAQTTATVPLHVYRIAPPPPSADLTLTAAGPQGAVIGGQTTTLRVDVASAGPNTARRVQMVLELGEGLTAGVPATLDGWVCTPSAQRLVCERPQLPANASTRLDVPVTTTETASRVARTFSARVDGPVADPRVADNAVTGEITVDPVPSAAPGGGTPAGPAPPQVTPPPVNPVDRAEVAAQMKADLARVARTLVKALRRRGRVRVPITFLAPGRHQVRLETVGRKRVVVAKGTLTTSRAGRQRLTLKLTRKGKRIVRLRRPPRMRLVDRFTGAGVNVTTKVVLKRRG